MPNYIIAHDLGTSGNKSTLFTTDGDFVRSSTVSYPVHFFGQNCAEQNADDWWSAVCKATKEVMQDISNSDVIAMSFSAQMQGCLLVDNKGIPLRPSIIWADHRSTRQAEILKSEVGFDRIYEITGHRLSPSYSLEKIMWLKAHEPDVYKKAYKFLQAKDYIIFKLTGNFVTDYSDASGTNALDLSNWCWSDELLEASGINKSLMPQIFKSTDIIGTITKEAAQKTGLLTGTPIVCGGGDGPSSAVGAGCIHDNELFATFGTSAWIGGTTINKFLDLNKTLFCFAHVIPERFMPCGTMQSAGGSYSYAKNLFDPEDSYSVTNQMIASSPAGAKNLLFLPYMLGERSPRWNTNTSGAFLGIKMHHTREDYLRSVIEGVAYNLELILQAYKKYLTVDSMILTGGGAKGDIICQILADIFETSLHTPNHVEEATSIGAAMVAGVGVGVYDNFESVTKFLNFQKSYIPNLEHKEIYDHLKLLFDRSYYALESVFKDL